MKPLPGGAEYEISADGYVAAVSQVGASLRVLRHGRRDLVASNPADVVRPVYRGAVLAPWPNRIADGRYELDGLTHQVPVNEVDRMNALHGLVAWAPWQLVEHVQHQVVLAYRLHPLDGYPFMLDLQVAYRLGRHGLEWEIACVNVGDDPAPYGCALHPYLVAGPGRVDDWTLSLPAEQYLTVSPDRLLPVDLEPVADTAFDFRTARPIGTSLLDHAFTRLVRDENGQATVTVADASGAGVAMRWDEAWPWVQIHTADRPEPELNRCGLAVEPMTCPPDAFNSGHDLVTLQPGDEHRARWHLWALP
ncbi:MAG TPA: aldose 1-epimerase family protein [Nocardioidaceae bacterium]|nr:aldose 1-epimerase family protein [Nocardioidaceae bacterium]